MKRQFLSHLILFGLILQTSLPAASLLSSRAHKKWLKHCSDIEKAAEEGSPSYRFEVHRGSGTSVYLKVFEKEKLLGAVLPENTATNIEAELVTYNLALFFGLPELAQEAASMILKGEALKSFEKQLGETSFSGQKEANRLAVLKLITQHPEGLPTVYKRWLPAKPIEINSLAVPSTQPNGSFNTAHPLAPFLQADQPQPARGIMILAEAPKAPTQTLVLATQLSNIMLLDAIMSQWDRYSGGNLHAYIVNDRVQLTALDNGGANYAFGQSYFTGFKQWVTRFDGQTVEQLYALDDFLQGRSANIRGYRTPGDLLQALGLSTRTQPFFIKRLALVRAHVQSCTHTKSGYFLHE